MPTTIQVEESTKQLLDEIKRRERASSYNEVIMRLAKEKSKVPDSMFGALGRARSMKVILRGLRDERDRI
ncbi:MAG: hypothetical protein HYW25_06105 [Candidatus Aenigmarchaeota archaeon]|nr:hypothetical protein [Candidatus Aenigmarchaeota archaeon]